MGQASGAHWYRLEQRQGGQGIYCGIEGAFIGSVPLLKRVTDAQDRASWSPRALDEINNEVGEAYGLPVDFSAKSPGLVTAAQALNAGDVATAQAAILNLHLPDLPDLAKGGQRDEKIAELLVELYFSRLLPNEMREQIAKFDPRLHPRWPAGTESSQGGQFRPNDDNLLLPVSDEKESDKNKSPTESPAGRPSTKQEINRSLRRQSDLAERQVKAGLRSKGEVIGEFLNRMGVGDAMADAFVRFLSRFDDPRTLDELVQLSKDPSRQHAGYERHHIVEQGPNEGRFSDDQMEGPDNVIAIPYYKHRDISDFYSTKDETLGMTPRDYLRGKSFEEQYRYGLGILRKFGVLK